MALLCIIAYSCDVCHSKGESAEERRAEETRKSKKAGLRILKDKFGVKVIIETAQGTEPSLPDNMQMSEQEKDNIVDYMTYLLSKDPKNPVKPESVTISELLDCLQPDNAVERIAYRREVS